MKTEYKKDLRHSYMIISKESDVNTEYYSVKMLENQRIEGVLPLEQRRLNESTLYYYDISSRQSMAALLDKAAFSVDKIRCLCTAIINTLERAYEYLLPEDDFILTPEYIYLGIESDEVALCFLPGYGKCIIEQMSALLEQLMNKVDYNDKEAVLLVYRMYAVSREDGYTLEQLMKELQEPVEVEVNIRKPALDKSEMMAEKEVKTPGSPAYQDITYPVMAEKLEQEIEIECYPWTTYLYTGAGILGGSIVLVLGFTTRLIYNSFGSRIDYSKLTALLLIIFCLEGYLMKQIWDKKNKKTRMITKNEYVDPRQYIHTPFTKAMERIKKLNKSGLDTIEADNSRTHMKEQSGNMSS